MITGSILVLHSCQVFVCNKWEQFCPAFLCVYFVINRFKLGFYACMNCHSIFFLNAEVLWCCTIVLYIWRYIFLFCIIGTWVCSIRENLQTQGGNWTWCDKGGTWTRSVEVCSLSPTSNTYFKELCDDCTDEAKRRRGTTLLPLMITSSPHDFLTHLVGIYTRHVDQASDLKIGKHKRHHMMVNISDF